MAAKVSRHVRHFKSEYQFVCATRDYHEDPGDHFSDHPDFHNSWPPHCVAGTPGAGFCPPIQNLVREKLVSTVLTKGQHSAAYSGFEALDPRGHTMIDVLKEARVDHMDICGLATDYCVRATALDARKHDFQVRVLVNLCAAVNAGDRAAGARGDEGSRLPGPGSDCALVLSRQIHVPLPNPPPEAGEGEMASLPLPGEG